MRFAILGSGAVGGYYGAKLARAGHAVTLIARGAHLAAIRQRGLAIRSPMLGDFTVHAPAEEDTTRVGQVDVVLVAVKAYDNPTALPLIAPMLGPDSVVLTVQNGLDSAADVAAAVGEAPVLGGTTYIASALTEPGVIEQTGTHRRIVFGEVFGELPRQSARVRAIHGALNSADIQSEAVDDGRVPIWEKFIFLVTLGLHWRVKAADRSIVGRSRDPGAVSRRLPRGRACRPSGRRGGTGGRDRTDYHIRCRDSRHDAIVTADRSLARKADRG